MPHGTRRPGEPRGRGLVGRLHALLRVWLPQAFRKEHGDQMERVFRDRLAEPRMRHHRWVLATAWIREAWDLAATGIRLRWRHRRSSRRSSAWTDDLAGAVRGLRRSPGFTAFAIGTLALGMGASIAFASFLDRIVLRPVDFPGGDRLVMVMRARDDARLRVSPDLATRDRVRRTDVFEGVAAVSSRDVVWSAEDGPRVLRSLSMDAALPSLAQLPPLLGRYFDTTDLRGDGAPVVVLSERFWRSAFGADPGVLGKTIRVEGSTRTIVGVAPDALRPPTPGTPEAEIFLPLASGGPPPGLQVFARLRDGITLAQANERVKALDLAAAEAERSSWSAVLVPAAEMATARLRSPLKVAGAAVVILLLIACLNVANLLLARGDARAHDTAVRLAVGAGRARLAREALFESGVIAAAAGALGLWLAAGTLSAVRRLHPAELGILDGLRMDPGVTALALACGLTTVTLFGLVPLSHRLRTRAGAVLGQRSGTAGTGTLSMRRLLLAFEVALSFALLAGGVQVVEALRVARARDPGFDIDGLLAVVVRLPEWRFADAQSREQVLGEIRSRLAGLPGVQGVAAAVGAPPRTGIYFGDFQADGQPAPEGNDPSRVFFGNDVDPDWFPLVGQDVLRGRGFTAEDARADPAPWILGESAAAEYFPGGDAVGGRMRIGDDSAWHPIVGVVRDVWVTGSPTDPGYPQLYVPREAGEGRAFLVRADDPGAVAPEVRAAIRAVDAEIPVLDVQPVAAGYRDALARERLLALLLAAFAATASALAAVGLYGVVAQVAVRRTREYGIRISLGAGKRAIFALALRGGALAVITGLAVGALGAWVGLRVLEMGISGLDRPEPAAFVASALLLSLAAVLAMAVPAAHAAGTDPTEALRRE